MISEKNLTIEDLKEYKNNIILILPFNSYDEEIYNIYDYKYIGYSTLEET